MKSLLEKTKQLQPGHTIVLKHLNIDLEFKVKGHQPRKATRRFDVIFLYIKYEKPTRLKTQK